MVKKVLFVVNTMGRAGAETALCSMLRVMDHSNMEISLLSLVNRGEMFDTLPPYVKVLNRGFNIGSVHDARGAGTLRRTILRALFKGGYVFRRRNMRYLRRMFKAQRAAKSYQMDKLFWHAIANASPRLSQEYDLAVAYLEGGATYYVADFVTARKKAAFVHIDYATAGYVKQMDEPYYLAMDRIFCVSAAVRSVFLSAFPAFEDKTFLFHNTIVAQDVREKALQGCGFTDGFTGTRLLTMGRLHPQKAYDVAIDVTSKLIERGHNVRWYVLGEGALREELEALVEEKGMREHFKLPGAVQNPYPYLRQCDIYVQATRFEGWSISVGEALILKKHIVASNCTGNTEQIENEKTGLIIELGTNEVVQGIERMMRDGELKAKIDENLKDYEFNFLKDFDMLYNML